MQLFLGKAYIIILLSTIFTPINFLYPANSNNLSKDFLSAAKAGNNYLIKKLIKDGIDLESCNNQNNTALIEAVSSDHIKTVAILLQAGANPNVRNISGVTPLMCAILNNRKEIIELLLDKGADINASLGNNEVSGTPLTLAVLHGNIEIISFLLERGAHINAKDSDGFSALPHATLVDRKDIVTLLISKGAHVNSPLTTTGQTVLMWAAGKGYDNIVKLLLEKKASIDVQEENGFTALAFACSYGHEKVAQILIERGANVNAIGATEAPLIQATIGNHKELVELLLKSNALVDAKENTKGLTALMIATLKGHKEIMGILLKAGADVNAQDNDGRTALMFAVVMNNKDIAFLLIKSGAYVNTQGSNGDTALHLAAYNGCKNIAKMLIDAGADSNIQDNDGDTALVIAKRRDYKEIVRILEQNNTRGRKRRSSKGK